MKAIIKAAFHRYVKRERGNSENHHGQVLALALTMGLTVGGIGQSVSAQQAESDSVVASKRRVINGKEFIFEKHRGEDDELQTVVINGMGRVVNEKAVPRAKHKVIGRKLGKMLRERAGRRSTGKTIKVNIALDLPEEDAEEVPESGGVELSDGVAQRLTLNGNEVSDAEFEKHHRGKEHARGNRAVGHSRARKDRVLAWAERHGFETRKAVQHTIESTGSTVTLELTAEEIEALARTNDGTIRGIELFQEGEDDITQAMVDTSISSSALPYSSTQGDNVGIYMTESGCPNENRITNYDRLSGSETNHSRNVGAIIRAVSPGSFIYCRGGAVLPTFGDLYGAFFRWLWPPLDPPIQIVTRSNSTNDNTSYTILDRDYDNFVYSHNIPLFNSGGNTGNGTGNVRSPGKGLNVITVGNYNDANDTIVTSSPFVDPQTGNEKPEVVAPGANITAGGFTFSGTSQATPHAAAFAGDMMSSSTYLKGKPYLVKAKMLAGSTDSISGGLEKTGLGGIDFESAQWSGYYRWYEGSNSSFEYFDQADGNNDNYVTKRIYISRYWDRARAVLVWLTRGSYTYDHRSNAHPIGMDLDLRVYDPYGRYVGGSFSWDNPYEKVEFSPTVSGYYTFKIRRYANRDTANKLRMGMYVNYFNN